MALSELYEYGMYIFAIDGYFPKQLRERDSRSQLLVHPSSNNSLDEFILNELEHRLPKHLLSSSGKFSDESFPLFLVGCNTNVHSMLNYNPLAESTRRFQASGDYRVLIGISNENSALQLRDAVTHSLQDLKFTFNEDEASNINLRSRGFYDTLLLELLSVYAFPYKAITKQLSDSGFQVGHISTSI